MIGAFRVLNRHMRVFLRTWRHNLMFNVVEPLLYLSAMGFGLGAFVQEINGMSYIQFIAPGMVALSAMYSATFECTYGTFVRLHYEKTFQAMLATPITVRDVVLGEVLYGTIKSVMFGTVILGVVAALGQIKSVYALAIPLLLVIHGLVFSSLALCYTSITQTIDYLNYYITLVILPFFLFGGLYFPVSALPFWVQLVNWANPLYHTVEVCRALALGQLSFPLLYHVFVLMAIGCVLLPIPLKLMEKRLLS
jgi:lipooligosaccharide transport system permease protein